MTDPKPWPEVWVPTTKELEEDRDLFCRALEIAIRKAKREGKW